jgi:hypothetical protein
MWNSGYWQCPYKSHPSHCMDSDTDDVGFLEALTKALLDKLPSKPADVSSSCCYCCRSRQAYAATERRGLPLQCTVLLHFSCLCWCSVHD